MLLSVGDLFVQGYVSSSRQTGLCMTYYCRAVSSSLCVLDQIIFTQLLPP